MFTVLNVFITLCCHVVELLLSCIGVVAEACCVDLIIGCHALIFGGVAAVMR